jgi:hypothetical protein
MMSGIQKTVITPSMQRSLKPLYTRKLSGVEQQIAAFQKHCVAADSDITRCPPPGSSAHHVLSDEELLVFLSSSGDEGTDEDTKATLCQSKGKGKASDPHQPGPLPDEACREVHELGDQVITEI